MTERAPRLRVERLVIVESRSPLTFIRDLPLHGGLNIVWAEDLADADGGSDVQRAGHGVGKSTFSLMLRAVLGDEGASVKTMRNHLAEYYGSGGIAAEVVAGTERFAVFRSFGGQSFALRDAKVEGLFEEHAKGQDIDFSTYVATLGEQACLQHMATRVLPVTGQAVEWGHVLCWLARDQALGLRQYFEWRNDDGTGLRRKVKDPPALTRLVLGLLSDAEAKAEAAIASVNNELTGARDALRREEQRGTNTRAIVETQLRLWAKVSPSLDMVTDDLFAPSVEKVVSETTKRLEREIEEARTAIDTLDRELIELAAKINALRHTTDLAKARWDEALALREKDSQALKGARERRDLLLQLAGSCQYGEVAYSECSYIQQQLSTVRLSAQKTIEVLMVSASDLEKREATGRATYQSEASVLGGFTETQEQQTERKKALNKIIGERQRLLGEGDSVRKTLAEWRETRQAPETEKLRTVRSNVGELEKKLEGTKGAKVLAQQQVSDRERDVNARFDKLAEAFGAQGRCVPADEKRPFHILRADGDAYTVLEILLGDLACAAVGRPAVHQRGRFRLVRTQALPETHRVFFRSPKLPVIASVLTLLFGCSDSAPPPGSTSAANPPVPVRAARRCTPGEGLGRSLLLEEVTCGTSLGGELPLPECGESCCVDPVVSLAIDSDSLAAMTAGAFQKLSLEEPDWSNWMLAGVFSPVCPGLPYLVRVRAASLDDAGILRLQVEHWGCGYSDAQSRPYDVVLVQAAEVLDLCVEVIETGCIDIPGGQRSCTEDPLGPG